MEELGQRLQHYAKMAADFRDGVSLCIGRGSVWVLLVL